MLLFVAIRSPTSRFTTTLWVSCSEISHHFLLQLSPAKLSRGLELNSSCHLQVILEATSNKTTSISVICDIIKTITRHYSASARGNMLLWVFGYSWRCNNNNRNNTVIFLSYQSSRVWLKPVLLINRIFSDRQQCYQCQSYNSFDGRAEIQRVSQACFP